MSIAFLFLCAFAQDKHFTEKELYERHSGNFFLANGQINFKEETVLIWTAKTFYLLQIINDQNMLVEVRNKGDRETWWITAFQTEGMIDNKSYAQQEGWVRIGTKKYITALGSSKTVTLAIPLSVYDRP